MENICNFLKACREVALIQDENLFQTVDLFEGKNMAQVNLYVLEYLMSPGLYHASDIGQTIRNRPTETNARH